MAEPQVCSRCIMDSGVPGTRFDARGICSFCKLHDELDRAYPNDERGQARLTKMAAEIARAGRGKRYDCVVGLSGGRDSTFLLYLAVRKWKLRPLAVHFNDCFGNPTAGENMRKAVEALGVELRTVTADWRESKDIRLAFLKASTPELAEGTDLGIAAALYGVACREGIRHVLIGQSFRTEGICPLEWNFLDFKYLESVHRRFGTVPLRPWDPNLPGYRLGFKELFYYSVRKGIRVHTPLYFYPYVRAEAEERLKTELGWVYPGAHYYDDLYQSFMTYLYRVKFGIDRRKFNYSALVRSGQMDRALALDSLATPYAIEVPDVIRLCIHRLGLSEKELSEILALPVKTFRDYPTRYGLIRAMKPLVWLASRARVIPSVTYQKYFACG